MKESYLNKSCDSRRNLELVSKYLGLETDGSRQMLVDRILRCSYKQIKVAINEVLTDKNK
jgi:hypothetical protein